MILVIYLCVTIVHLDSHTNTIIQLFIYPLGADFVWSPKIDMIQNKNMHCGVFPHCATFNQVIQAGFEPSNRAPTETVLIHFQSISFANTRQIFLYFSFWKLTISFEYTNHRDIFVQITSNSNESTPTLQSVFLPFHKDDHRKRNVFLIFLQIFLSLCFEPALRGSVTTLGCFCPTIYETPRFVKECNNVVCVWIPA